MQVQLITDFGLTVRFDGKSRAGKKVKPQCSRFSLVGQVNSLVSLFSSEIILPSTYRNYVRGLCGNYDGITSNEYMKPDGTVVRNLNSFGDSWRVSDRQRDGLKVVHPPHTIHR